MKFAELSEKAKEHVRQRQRDTELNYDWWEDVYVDAVTCGELMGIEIADRTANRTIGGVPTATPDISFSFGDGCCYSGYIDTTKCKGAIEKIKAHAPQDERLIELAGLAEELTDRVTAEHVAAKLDGNEDIMDYVFPGMRIDVRDDDRRYCTYLEDNDLSVDLGRAFNKFVTNFASWIYTQLEQERDYRLACDLGFDEDGNAE